MNRRNRLCAKNVAVFQSLFVKHTMKGDSYVRIFRPRGEIECARVYFRAFFRACLENKDLANFLISHKISLSEINHGFDLMKSPEAKRIIIEF